MRYIVQETSHCQAEISLMSKLFRNVPILTSLEMSPLFDFPLGSGVCWSLAWPEVQPCGARRAERLGRSEGPSQRRVAAADSLPAFRCAPRRAASRQG